MNKMSEMYNKGLLIMKTMQKHNINKEKARKAVEEYLRGEDKRIPDLEGEIRKILE